ncbi:MAG: hypothetical protein GWN58_52845, partial [Anaerolineae bacterium]|nr:hypothetical protein [Anaerolineae bacterium]
MTGLASCGVELIVGVTQQARQGYPMVPVLQVGVGDDAEGSSDLDLTLSGDPEAWPET